jgi:hypothetical protein
MKKILMILSIFLAVGLTLGAVSAFDLNFDFSAESNSVSNSDGGQVEYNDGELTIQDLDFNIPDGYKENSSDKRVAVDAGEKFKGCLLSADGFDKGSDYINVKVIFDEDDDLDNDSYIAPEDAVAKKIADHDGYLGEYDDEVVFDYFDDGKFVEVIAPDESVISSVIS